MKAHVLLPDAVNHVTLDGVTVRKGSVGAFLASARVWGDPAGSAAAREEAARDLAELVPALRALGLFDVFEIRDAALARFVASC